LFVYFGSVDFCPKANFREAVIRHLNTGGYKWSMVNKILSNCNTSSNSLFSDFSYHKFLKRYSPDHCKPITGIKGHFPALVYFPQEKVFERYHPSITSLIQDICLRGEQNDRIKYLHDLKASEVFFLPKMSTHFLDLLYHTRREARVFGRGV
jgi:hypothetical protein